MNALRQVLSLHAGSSPAQRLWLLGAVIAAACLLSFYVSLLNEQVVRGEQLRQALRGASNHTASNQKVVRLAVLPTSLAVTPPRRVSAAADGQAR
jgi:hypothetical protein